MANSRFCICREHSSPTLWFTITMPPYFPLFLSEFGKSKSNSLIDSTLRSQRLLNPRLLQSHSENPKRTSSTGHCAVVCESNSVPKRSKLLSCECSWCSCRGTQEAHRAVSNEALYGVFRISGLITLTYLHLWNCWQAVLIPCFPALGQRTPSPHTIIIALDQLLSRSFLFSFFNCFKIGVSHVFFQLWFCASTYSWPSINVHAAFSPAWNYIAYGKL